MAKDPNNGFNVNYTSMDHRTQVHCWYHCHICGINAAHGKETCSLRTRICSGGDMLPVQPLQFAPREWRGVKRKHWQHKWFRLCNYQLNHTWTRPIVNQTCFSKCIGSWRRHRVRKWRSCNQKPNCRSTQERNKCSTLRRRQRFSHSYPIFALPS